MFRYNDDALVIVASFEFSEAVEVKSSSYKRETSAQRASRLFLCRLKDFPLFLVHAF